ncbi:MULTISPECIES: Rieske 2Fe-2S domain-containing protein [unclassified Paenibacillus]|uniref:Rieske (2Fe-2S) protein n=1 Tax=unclassified Paenibacillus TaxID=185978 RepID=UPI001AE9D505|nr:MULTISPECIES: Rieske 2Fe-2S domain-containing protein [unclassified Paenibacillus]MBP1155842.1 nitrite reductase/ring-hydroxylating ferredoxin subunit [Paenibacillus sp. PvP091]MBP1168772.1 nitrite reductase/ring-hydroxylating ferredoxin subunit [Paenibacillus sp. PvR098]MBP2439800.1 nitrite reductase/ring-hydroxylating ferredoxin subunit [Paenibacillus sp. PvP052]
MGTHYVCPAADITVGSHRVFQIGRHSFGVFKVEGSYYAVRNYCPHQGGPLCEESGVFDQIDAEVTDNHKVREFISVEKNLVACPWHGIEFDVRTGECLVRKDWKVRTYKVHLDSENNLLVELPD